MAEKIAASPAVTVKLARKVIAHLSRPQIRTSMEDELIYQTFLNKSEDFAEFRRPSRGANRTTGVVMPEFPGLPAPPPVGTSACRQAPSRARACSSPAAEPASGKRSPRSSPASGPTSSSPRESRTSRGRRTGHLPTSAPGSRRSNATSATLNRSRRHSMPPRPFGMPSVLVNNAAANFPVPAEDMSPNAAHRRRHHPQRHLLRRPRIRATTPRRRDARLDHQCRGVVRLDRWSRFRPQRRSKAGVKNMVETLAVEWGPYGIQVNGLVPGPDAPRGHDRRHPGQPRPHPRQGCDPTRIAGRPAPGTRLGGDIPRVPLRPLHLRPHSWSTAPTGSAGASPIPRSSPSRDQMGRGPFEP